MKIETTFELNVKKPVAYQFITTCNTENKIVLNGLAEWYLINGLCPYCLKKITTIGNFTIELNNLCTCKKS